MTAAHRERSGDPVMRVHRCEIDGFNNCSMSCTEKSIKEGDLQGVKCVRGSPRAKAQASAALSVHPVPCVFFESKYGLTNNVYFPPPSSSPTSHRTSTTTGTSQTAAGSESRAAAWNRISIFTSCCTKFSHRTVILCTRGSFFAAMVAAAASTSAIRKLEPPCATCPPLTSTARGPSAHRAREARTISSIEEIFIRNEFAVFSLIPTAQRKSSASASVVFGVSTVARGRSSSMSTSSASFCESRSEWPDVDTQTGSSTSDGGDCRDGSRALRVCLTVRIMSALASIPVLMAATLISSKTDRSCGGKSRLRLSANVMSCRVLRTGAYLFFDK